MKEKNDLTTREGYSLALKGDDTRVRFDITDLWTGERFRFELGSIAADILLAFILKDRFGDFEK